MTELHDLSPEQRQVVESWGRGMAVLAGAGSGKTTTLVIKCAELLKRNPKARFAAVSFTEKSATDLRQKLSGRLSTLGLALSGEGGALSGHWVMTIHGLCGAILREYPREAGYDGEETMLAESEAQLLWERAIEQVWSDQAPVEVEAALSKLLLRENQRDLWSLLKRARDLASLGVLKSLSQQQDPDSQALATLAGFVLERYDRLKRRRGALDFNDLELGADRALENPKVREAYQNRFDLVLVDEFQDTNPVQARIILRFVKPDRSNLCVVGDPKQSIYRFRDADVSVFEDFCSKLPVTITLARNHRSRPGILSFTNEVCKKAFDASSLKYEPLVPHHPEGEMEPVLQLKLRAPEGLAHWVRQENQRGVPLRDMALLLRKIRGSERWLRALTAAGIPIAVGSGGLFWTDPRTRELVAFLKWWEQPAHSLSGAIFFRAPWMGVPDELLDLWRSEDPTWVKPFFSSELPMAKALAPFRERGSRPGELLMALLINRQVEEELGAALLGLWHRVEELSSRGLDFRAVVTEINLACEEKRRDPDVPPPRNQGQLSVLTIHGSKGLEFPHVILVDFGKKASEPKSPILYWDREQGAYLARRDLGGAILKDDEFKIWRERESSQERAENKRVFYVALTRAKERLILAWPELSEKDSQVDPGQVFQKDFWRGWIETSGALSKATVLSMEHSAAQRLPSVSDLNSANFTGMASPLRLENLAEFPLIRPRHSVTELNLLSRCPRAYEWTYIRPRPSPWMETEAWTFQTVLGGAAAAREESIDADEISQKELGTEVHACLESGNLERLSEIEARVGSKRFQAKGVLNWAEHSPQMNPKLGKLIQAWPELAFEVPIQGQVLVGSMDRVVELDSGLAVVDFKVTRSEKTPEELLEAYGTQMLIYRYALSRLSGKSPREIGAALINFSGTQACEVLIPAETETELDAHLTTEAQVEGLVEAAARIVQGEAGVARLSSLCEVCRFVQSCDLRMGHTT